MLNDINNLIILIKDYTSCKSETFKEYYRNLILKEISNNYPYLFSEKGIKQIEETILTKKEKIISKISSEHKEHLTILFFITESIPLIIEKTKEEIKKEMELQLKEKEEKISFFQKITNLVSSKLFKYIEKYETLEKEIKNLYKKVKELKSILDKISRMLGKPDYKEIRIRIMEILRENSKLKKQLKEKENEILQLKEKNKILEQNLSEKEKLLKEQNKK